MNIKKSQKTAMHAIIRDNSKVLITSVVSCDREVSEADLKLADPAALDAVILAWLSVYLCAVGECLVPDLDASLFPHGLFLRFSSVCLFLWHVHISLCTGYIARRNRRIYVTKISLRSENLCILYEEEAPVRGSLLPFSVQAHLEGVALFVAFAEEVLPEVDLDHLADRAACLFEKPKRLDRVGCPAGVGEGLDAVLLHAGGEGFHIPVPDDVVEV
jgi:hypothetical protein